jgi:hypothetical protein
LFNPIIAHGASPAGLGSAAVTIGGAAACVPLRSRIEIVVITATARVSWLSARLAWIDHTASGWLTLNE